MSEVRRARDLRLGRDVAVKILRGDVARDPAFRARFRREANNAAVLNHPAIVAVFDTGETTDADGTVPFIVMEYVDGGTLRDVLTAQGRLSPRRAAWIAADICEALDFSHRHGIVHRDIKPANVMLSRDGAVKVMDFGIARTVDDDQATMVVNGNGIGTAHYLSPEQARGEAVDARSDGLFDRLPALRIAMRHTAFHRWFAGGDRLPAGPRGPEPAERGAARCAKGDGRHRPEGARQEPAEPLPDSRRDALGPGRRTGRAGSSQTPRGQRRRSDRADPRRTRNSRRRAAAACATPPADDHRSELGT
jgi:hypothetical protein